MCLPILHRPHVGDGRTNAVLQPHVIDWAIYTIYIYIYYIDYIYIYIYYIDLNIILAKTVN